MVGLTSMWHHACTAACPTSLYYDNYSICVAITSIVLAVIFALIYVLRLVKPRADDKRQKEILNVVYVVVVSILNDNIYMYLNEICLIGLQHSFLYLADCGSTIERWWRMVSEEKPTSVSS